MMRQPNALMRRSIRLIIYNWNAPRILENSETLVSDRIRLVEHKYLCQITYSGFIYISKIAKCSNYPEFEHYGVDYQYLNMAQQLEKPTENLLCHEIPKMLGNTENRVKKCIENHEKVDLESNNDYCFAEFKKKKINNTKMWYLIW